jgi:hypothetical protein
LTSSSIKPPMAAKNHECVTNLQKMSISKLFEIVGENTP